tara:strand:- start:5778 stop:6077 length:300 start_codon:yes stop_codon:yes gene_type:complete
MTKIAAILKQYEWSTKDLYRKIGELGGDTGYYALTQMVNGKRTNYNLLTLTKICEALNVTPNEIIEDNISTFKNNSQIESAKAKEETNQSNADIRDLGF